MLTTLTSITAHTAMQQILLKTTPKVDANFQITEDARIEADQYSSIASRLGLGKDDPAKDWEATRNLFEGNRQKLVEVEMTEEDRNILIALLEKDIKDKEETLNYYRQMNSTSNVVDVFNAMVKISKDAVKELNEKAIQE